MVKINANEAWIIGKGPSLDYFGFQYYMYPRYAVNEAAFLIPNCVAICKDLRMVKIYQEKLPFDVPVYTKNMVRLRRLDNHIQYPMGKLLNAHYYPSSISMAIIIAKELGFTRLHLVGCDSVDGIQGYANCVKTVAHCAPKYYNDHSVNELKTIIINEGVDVVWEHRVTRTDPVTYSVRVRD